MPSAVRRGEEFARGLGSTGTPDFYLRRGYQKERVPVASFVDQSFAEGALGVLGRQAD